MPWKVLERACHDGCVRDTPRADPLGARGLLSAASHLPVAILKSLCSLPVFPLIIIISPLPAKWGAGESGERDEPKVPSGVRGLLEKL